VVATGLVSVHRDEIVIAEDEGDVDGVKVVGIFGRLTERDGAHDQQNVAIEFLELDAGLRVERLLDCERMKMKYVLEQRDVGCIARIDIDPEGSDARCRGARDLVGTEMLPDFPAGIGVAAPEVRLLGGPHVLDWL
jgi:hypothetical protein